MTAQKSDIHYQPRSLRRHRKPEVLAPAGGHPQLLAAIENGADAVYFGLTTFSARARAANFTPQELPAIMETLHERGVAGVAAINTLVFDEELYDIEQLIAHIDRSNVDAVIVQDLAICEIVRRVAPNMPIHASTQMTVTSAESAMIAESLGAERVVLGRELSVREIKAVAEATSLELEVFVHGALCVSYSGQCFSSEAWGGRSANRGQCAQACRLPYELIVDGKIRSNEKSHVLSPQDLLGLHHIPSLVNAGVSCFKIEGRLKGPEYVALTTKAYRQAVDSAWADEEANFSQETIEELSQVFSRGFTPGFLDGSKHQRLVQGQYPKHRGIEIGVVTGVHQGGITASLTGPVKAGDGLLFERGGVEDSEVGTSVYRVRQGGELLQAETRVGDVTLEFASTFDLSGIKPDDVIWRTKDGKLESRVTKSWKNGPFRKRLLKFVVDGEEGSPISITATDNHGLSANVTGAQALEKATGRPLDSQRLHDTIGKLGGTVFTCESLDNRLIGELFMPPSALKSLRRELIECLKEKTKASRLLVSQRCDASGGIFSGPDGVIGGAIEPSKRPELVVLCRNMEQVRAALTFPELSELIVDFLEVKGLREAVELIQSAGKRAIVASPRVLKPSEERLVGFLVKLGADAILVRSLGLLYSLASRRSDEGSDPLLYGDFSLNAANRPTVELLGKAGIKRLAMSHDLNRAQLCSIASAGARNLEFIVHHHLPIFHTEHCVFARFLSDGNNKDDCGKPCESHTLHLQSRDGKQHLVEADVGCRNTVFNAEAQSGVAEFQDYLSAGFRIFRLELVDHSAAESREVIKSYLDVLAGSKSPDKSWAELRATRFGASRGSLKITRSITPEEMKRPGWIK